MLLRLAPLLNKLTSAYTASSLPSSSSSAASSTGVIVPPILYGTAWKRERTRTLVLQALRAGFCGIDTACQPKHYAEDLVGDGVADAIAEGIITRSELYLQTKFTPLSGQVIRPLHAHSLRYCEPRNRLWCADVVRARIQRGFPTTPPRRRRTKCVSRWRPRFATFGQTTLTA